MAAGTEVFIYKPGTDELIDLTAETGPGFGEGGNKYSWAGYFYDGDGDGIDELYIGTWNVVPDIPGVISAIVRIEGVNESDPDASGGGLSLNELGSLATIEEELAAPLKSDGGQVWRYDFEDEEWTKVLSAEHPGINDGDPGIRKITEFDGKMIAFSGRPVNMSDNVVKMFSTEDGENWTQLSGGPLEESEGNTSIRTVEIVKNGDGEDVLLMGTTNLNGAQVWTYEADGTWTKVATLPAIVHSEIFVDTDGDVYVGTWLPYSLYKLDIDAPFPFNLQNVTPAPVGETIDDTGVMRIIEFGDYYYIGSSNYSGVSLYRTMDLDDPTSWEVITTDGFETDADGNELLDSAMAARGVAEVDYTWRMQVVEDALYIAVYSGTNGIVIRSENGTDWEILDEDYGEEDYGVRTLLGFGLDEDGLPDDSIEHNALVIGTATPYSLFPSTDDILPSGGIISGTIFTDFLSGTDDEDLIIGLAGGDIINGGAEDDIIFSDLVIGVGAGNDQIQGGSGDDLIIADFGDDTARGDEGQDVIAGGVGRDMIYGGDGIDLLLGDEFLNEQVLGALSTIGLDIIEIEGSDALDSILPGGVSDALAAAISLGNGVLDEILPQEVADAINNALGNYDDMIYGEGDGDVLIGGLGQDRLYGGEGRDIAYGGLGDDRLYGEADDDFLFGEDGRDLIFGHGGDDVALGGNGNDQIYGNEGNDTLYGQAGNDNIRGGTGDDEIDGGLGNDAMRGGDGADIFVIGEVSGNDRIFDFQNGVDKIDISELGVDAGSFADALDDATSRFFFFSTRIDLTEFGGDGSILLVGVNESQIDVTDFIIA